MRVLSARLFLLLLLVGVQAVQGVLTGVALCREETGEVALEWASNGQCGQPGRAAVPCTHDGSGAVGATADHCGTCFDVPLPSETSLKSGPLSYERVPVLASGVLVSVSPDPAPARPASRVPFPGAASEHLRSVRLLI